MGSIQDEYVRARDALIAVRQVQGGELLALAIYDGLEANDASRVVAATREAEAWLGGWSPVDRYQP